MVNRVIKSGRKGSEECRSKERDFGGQVLPMEAWRHGHPLMVILVLAVVPLPVPNYRYLYSSLHIKYLKVAFMPRQGDPRV